MIPDHVGAPLGQEHGGATYFMIEMHYENPEGRTCKLLFGRLMLINNLKKL